VQLSEPGVCGLFRRPPKLVDGLKHIAMPLPERLGDVAAVHHGHARFGAERSVRRGAVQ